MKKLILYSILGLTVSVTSGCNNFLDSEPITQVSTNAYLYAENDLAAYAANIYGWLPSHGSGYNIGLFATDNGTDNQTAASPSSLFVKGQTHVGDAGNLWYTYAQQLRTVNYFLQTVLPRYQNGEISGSAANVSHYIGEMYFFRAWTYILSGVEDLRRLPDCDFCDIR